MLLLVLSAMAFMYACSMEVKTDASKTHSYSSDMEYEKWTGAASLVSDMAHSGKFSCRVDSLNPYSFGFVENLKNINDTILPYTNISVWVNYPATGIKSNLVISIDSSGKNIFWLGIPLKDSITVANQWKEIKATVTLPENVMPDNKIVVYVWSEDKRSFYIDDLKVEFPEK